MVIIFRYDSTMTNLERKRRIRYMKNLSKKAKIALTSAGAGALALAVALVRALV